MSVCCKIVVVYLLTIYLEVRSQFYPNYGQYGYQPYSPYQGNQGYQGYTPYPYIPSQSYSPYVSNFPNYYQYYPPVQNYPSYNSQPQYNVQPAYYSQPQYSSRPVQQYYPTFSSGATYPSGYTPYAYPTSSQTAPAGTVKNETEEDPYANIKTEIVDIDPRYFDYYKRFFNLEDNLYPVDVIDDSAPGQSSRVGGSSHRPSYIVKTESKHTNFTSPQLGVSKHEVQSKTYSFKKTFTLNPNQKENAVVNLNFVNGVQVTDSPIEPANETTTLRTTFDHAETEIETTTESEKPDTVSNWFS